MAMAFAAVAVAVVTTVVPTWAAALEIVMASPTGAP